MLEVLQSVLHITEVGRACLSPALFELLQVLLALTELGLEYTELLLDISVVFAWGLEGPVQVTRPSWRASVSFGHHERLVLLS